jgi:hypothetical protein
MKTGAKGIVIPPLRIDGQRIDKHTPGNRLRAALADVGLVRPGFGLPGTEDEREKPQKLW